MVQIRELTAVVAKASLHRIIATAYESELGWSNHDQDKTWVKLSGGLNRLMLKNQRIELYLVQHVLWPSIFRCIVFIDVLRPWIDTVVFMDLLKYLNGIPGCSGEFRTTRNIFGGCWLMVQVSLSPLIYLVWRHELNLNEEIWSRIYIVNLNFSEIARYFCYFV